MYKVFILISVLLLASCDTDEELLIPSFGKESILAKAKKLDAAVMSNSEGIYAVDSGGVSFGDSVVLKWNNGKPSIFCGANAAFMILGAGELDKEIVFEGYWRFAYGLETGLVKFVIAQDEGAKELLAGDVPASIVLRGGFGRESSEPGAPIVLRFARKIRTAVDTFHILGHRGGARNSDLHPHSENSVEMIEFAEQLGCTGVEIDIRLTLDGVPMLYHDEKMNTRLIKADFLVGPFSDYTSGQLRRFASLINDEKIPTLTEALETVLNKTQLRFVWLDIKTPDVVAKIAPIVNDFQKRATQQGRDLEIVMGLPEDDIYNAYLALPAAERPKALCELSIDQARSSNATVWAPRWTLGTQLDEVRQMHSEGRRVFTWTLDLASFIFEFFRDGEFDGFLTNYPTIVAYMYYMRK
jgi:glycerophosphoryl diester phosphodiesterase